MDKNYTITPKQAQSIIDIACSSWKIKLAREWGISMALNSSINISAIRYKEMREACTSDQHKLFDEIFGKYTPKVDFSILNDVDVFYVGTNNGYEFIFIGNKFWYEVPQGLNISNNSKITSKICTKDDVIELRPATRKETIRYLKEYLDIEIGEYVKIEGNRDPERIINVENNRIIAGHRYFSVGQISKIISPYEEGELILCRNDVRSNWEIARTTGKLEDGRVEIYSSDRAISLRRYHSKIIIKDGELILP